MPPVIFPSESYVRREYIILLIHRRATTESSLDEKNIALLVGIFTVDLPGNNQMKLAVESFVFIFYSIEMIIYFDKIFN